MKILMIVLQILLVSVTFADDRAYFEQFIYKVENISDDPDFPEYQYRSLLSDSTLRVATADGKNLMLWINLYLLENGTFKLIYKENVMQDNGGFFPNGRREINGNWDVRDTTLVVGEIATGIRHFSDNRNQVLIKFNLPIISKEVVNIDINFDYGYSNYPIEMASPLPFPF